MTREEAIANLAMIYVAFIGFATNEQRKLIKDTFEMATKALEEQEPIGHCKDCKFFEYDSVAKVDGIPLIVAHEICNKWGDGCKTKEDGHCFLFEPQESEVSDGC